MFSEARRYVYLCLDFEGRLEQREDEGFVVSSDSYLVEPTFPPPLSPRSSHHLIAISTRSPTSHSLTLPPDSPPHILPSCNREDLPPSSIQHLPSLPKRWQTSAFPSMIIESSSPT